MEKEFTIHMDQVSTYIIISNADFMIRALKNISLVISTIQNALFFILFLDPYIDGVRINSPHYLCKIEVNDQTPRRLSLVVSQYEKSTTIYYTVRIIYQKSTHR